jgi:dynein heavy chain
MQFIPASFEAVSAACERYQAVDGRFCYTTPKSFLELLKL